MDVELGRRLAGRGEAERCVERCGCGEERAGVDEAEGRGREGGRQVWADEGVEGDGGGGARVGDGEGEVGEGGREADYEGEGGDGERRGGGCHCCLVRDSNAAGRRAHGGFVLSVVKFGTAQGIGCGIWSSSRRRARESFIGAGPITLIALHHLVI